MHKFFSKLLFDHHAKQIPAFPSQQYHMIFSIESSLTLEIDSLDAFELLLVFQSSTALTIIQKIITAKVLSFRLSILPLQHVSLEDKN